jgi:threonine/homoserine/homoserine lactone efflux protein
MIAAFPKFCYYFSNSEYMPSNFVKTFWKGLTTGLILQLAIGPVFIFLVNLTLQKTFWHGLVALCAVNLVDYFYILVAILGLGKILTKPRVSTPIGILGSAVLILFGLITVFNGFSNFSGPTMIISSDSFGSSFIAAFIITISSPLAIVFFTGVFAAKAIENKFTKKELYVFGLSTGLATFLFMGTVIVLVSLIRGTLPIVVVRLLNVVVGILLVTYGVVRLYKLLRRKEVAITLNSSGD